jgi:hypothetical protein
MGDANIYRRLKPECRAEVSRSEGPPSDVPMPM